MLMYYENNLYLVLAKCLYFIDTHEKTVSNHYCLSNHFKSCKRNYEL